MNTHLIKKPSDLLDEEIKKILDAWEVDEWKNLDADAFRIRFEHSEFHLLTDDNNELLAIARINFKFKVKIGTALLPIAELVGFVAVDILKGFGKTLLKNVAENLRTRNIESIGFCRKRTSQFYVTAGFNLFADKVKFLREHKDDQWFTPTEDDDIINLTLTEQTAQLFESINDASPAYLIFE